MITFFSTHCPKCKVIEMKLNQKNIKYNTITDIDEMRKIGLMSAPALKVDDELLLFSEAVKYINNLN